MHRPARHEREETGKDDPEAIARQDLRPVARDVPAAGSGDGPCAIDEREERKQMDRAERADQPQLVDEEAGYGGRDHQSHPDSAKPAMQGRALGKGQQEGTEKGGRDHGRDMDLDGKGCLQKGFEYHAALSSDGRIDLAPPLGDDMIEGKPFPANARGEFVNRPDMQSALREWLALFASRRLWTTFIIVVLVFTLTGPFGTLERLNGWMRFGYWLTLQGAAWTTAMVFIALVGRLWGDRLSSPLLHLAASTLPAGLLIAAEVEIIDYLFFGLLPDPARWLQNLAVSLPLCALISLLAMLTGERQAVAAKPAAEPPARSPSDMTAAAPSPDQILPPPLLKRLKPENRGRVLRLSAEDHYTRVVTTGGAELVLIRFADALAELGQAEGLRVHRSHWVADEAVREFRKLGQNGALLLRDGSEVPVSRSHSAAVRQRFAAS